MSDFSSLPTLRLTTGAFYFDRLASGGTLKVILEKWPVRVVSEEGVLGYQLLREKVAPVDNGRADITLIPSEFLRDKDGLPTRYTVELKNSKFEILEKRSGLFIPESTDDKPLSLNALFGLPVPAPGTTYRLIRTPTEFSGEGPPPNSLGLNGDYYVDTVSAPIRYFRKKDGVWVNLQNSGDTFVTLAGAQTIGGLKTYSVSPLFPIPAADDNSGKGAPTSWVRARLDSLSTSWNSALATVSGVASAGFAIATNHVNATANAHSATAIGGLSTVATTGNYADLLNLPTLGSGSLSLPSFGGVSNLSAPQAARGAWFQGGTLTGDVTYIVPASTRGSVLVSDVSTRSGFALSVKIDGEASATPLPSGRTLVVFDGTSTSTPNWFTRPDGNIQAAPGRNLSLYHNGGVEVVRLVNGLPVFPAGLVAKALATDATPLTILKMPGQTAPTAILNKNSSGVNLCYVGADGNVYAEGLAIKGNEVFGVDQYGNALIKSNGFSALCLMSPLNQYAIQIGQSGGVNMGGGFDARLNVSGYSAVQTALRLRKYAGQSAPLMDVRDQNDNALPFTITQDGLLNVRDVSGGGERMLNGIEVLYDRRVAFYVEEGGLEGGIKADSVLYLKAPNGLSIVAGSASGNFGNDGAGNLFFYSNSQIIKTGYDRFHRFIANGAIGTAGVDPQAALHTKALAVDKPAAVAQGLPGQTAPTLVMSRNSSEVDTSWVTVDGRITATGLSLNPAEGGSALAVSSNGTITADSPGNVGGRFYLRENGNLSLGGDLDASQTGKKATFRDVQVLGTFTTGGLALDGNAVISADAPGIAGGRLKLDTAGKMRLGPTDTGGDNSILELSSTTRGFLPPRMTTTQRDVISNPTEGLQIWNTTTHRPNFYTGTAWIEPQFS